MIYAEPEASETTQSEQTEEKPQVSLTEAEKAEKKRAKKARQRSARAQAAAQQVLSRAQDPDTGKGEQSAGIIEGRSDADAAPAALEAIETSSGKPVAPAEQMVSHLMQTEAPAGEPAKLSSEASAEAERLAGPIEGKRRGRSRRQIHSGAVPKPSPVLVPIDKAVSHAPPASDSAKAGPEAAQQADSSIHGDSSITLMAASVEASSGEAPQEPGHTDHTVPSSAPWAAHAAHEPASTAEQAEPWLEVRAGRPRPVAQQAATSAEMRKARKREKRLAKQAADKEAPLPSLQAQQQHEVLSEPSTPAEGQQHTPKQAPSAGCSNSAQPQAVTEPPMLQPSLRSQAVQHDAQPAVRTGGSIQTSVSLMALPFEVCNQEGLLRLSAVRIKPADTDRWCACTAGDHGWPLSRLLFARR